jgi:hypothetical protein
MYVKIRTDGAVGIGRATEGAEEITIGYGEAHMIAAALEKLAQTARDYKQVYKKTTDVGGGNKIEFERYEDGRISISGDKHTYYCTEREIRELAKLLKSLPPVQVAPASDYVDKTRPEDSICLIVKNSGSSAGLKLTEAALLKTAVVSSLDSRYFDEHLVVAGRDLAVNRSSDLKWKLEVAGNPVKFTAYEVEALVAGLHNGILDVLMDFVKSMGSDDIADIRVKSHIQRIEEEVQKVMADHKDTKRVRKTLSNMAKEILGGGQDADTRTNTFIEMCKYVYGDIEREFVEPLMILLAGAFVAES